MAKLIHILAASVGGGLVLGASIRLGEAIGSSARKPDRPRPKPDAALAGRLDRLERQVARMQTPPTAPASEWQAVLGDVVARIDRQQDELENIRHHVSKAPAAPSQGENATALRDDLHRQLSEDLDRRLADVEEKLHLSLKQANRDTVNAMVASIETRVAPRISQIENDITGQSAALSELRECSHQSERNILRLLTVLERVANQKPETAGAAAGLAVVASRPASVR